MFAVCAAMTVAALPADAKRGKKAPQESVTVLDKSGGGMISGRLEAGDVQLDSGEYYDAHTFEAQAGQSVTVDLYSNEFDTFLAVISPGGTPTRNDDFEGQKEHSQVILVATESGTWSVAATTYKPGEQGAYTLHIQLGASAAGGGAEPASIGSGGSVTGRLEAGDSQLDSGEYLDSHIFDASAGQTIVVELTSTEFDTYLAVVDPAGNAQRNDDHEGRKDLSRVEFVAGQTGSYAVAVTSYKSGETGAYTLSMQIGAAAPSEGGAERISGRLEPGDMAIESGEFVDATECQAQAGEFVVFDLRSTDFDPWLEVRSPGGETFVNDDHEGDAARSQLALTLTESGTYTVYVTTYKPGDSGAYDLAIHRGGAQEPASGQRVEQGRLEAGDVTLDSGEFADGYEIEGRPGQTLRLDLASTEFDTYMVLIPPSGDPIQNDDAPGQQGHSAIEATLADLGTYLVAVTSYRAGEVGAYTLTIEQGEGGGYSRQRDANTLLPGQPVSGRLEAGDSNLEGGEFIDLYVFDGTAGQKLVVELTATEFDPFVGVFLPSGGEAVENDDYEGRRDMARVEFQLQESGRYRVGATSYGAGESGSYQLTLRLEDGAAPLRPATSGGRIRGVFVGISDYPGEANDLPYTADDARNLQAAFASGVSMRAEDSVVLTDSGATVQAVRDAVTQLAAQAGPDDLFVFFYSGHGSRSERSDFQQSDPDGMDETLALFDGHITDDEFSSLLDSVAGGTTLLLLDACFSGGFSKDVISKPGRMGMFSSEEDVTSGVAAKFRAGGYLAQFVADGVGSGYADDGDGQLTSLELCQYVHERYRSDVKSGGGGVSDIVITNRVTGYQHLVVDRGSIGPYQVLFAVGK